MRIVSGDFGGRRLTAVPGTKTRPTTDKVKEAVFNVIGPYFDGGLVLDLFAGSGGLGIEAVSRGADHAYLIDRQFAAIKTIKSNIAVTKQETKFSVLKSDSHKILDKFSRDGLSFDLVFLDPPYAQQKIENDILKMENLNLLGADAKIICETNLETVLSDKIGQFNVSNIKEYGITKITVYQKG
ncbi:16S rRNA (guanine(966)-N(2))-methyltransferase RsmD [Pediococcus claussenii]|uniref:RNA methyltransferase, RsmD family n=1 Tax=Pediococcus claussenii (strain ATCC BAA-344 / DSM 14800 / JCM 18046 / KCTC 3811 / LMG 21948 / P06) TaxID=701521 RepID=G8PCX8_PEDCP|nr:16S rRNA (guanine(966)-N(2))-methyltransferase RsmD [Pediococcus claussenii]AEV95113.1 RNA methyltransferase, RsmD family [Pediococcus claussenii ATCC BAA-344]ANZ70299.1 16S rRNA (guanine(966)-N(2))-methyltransferase RsmD [Pediococcus claussenii]ANZ72115.1 16S rRNA (guanine(966)-N(2))-methyltransferase RsmD [Pediococcus claussenii]KRN18872.1 hypothetical protein IV79_GL000298 [Pediococcus claussenii]